MAPLPHDSASQLEAGRSKGFTEKPSSAHVHGNLRSQSGRTGESRAPAERMPSGGRLLLMLLVSLIVTFGLATALSPGDWHRRPYPRGDAVRHREGGRGDDGVSFTSLLEAASPDLLHELLHKYFPQRFKDGVWQSDVSAVEAVHRVDAALAVSIVQMARRADNGTTTTPPPPPPTTTDLPPPTTTSPPDGETGTDTGTGTASGPDTTTAPTSSSSTDSSVQSSSSSTESSSSSSSSSTTTTSAPDTSSGTSLITGRPTSSSTPSRKPVTSTFTSTEDSGGVVIVTTTSFVDADPVTTGPSTTRATPTLQNAAGPAGQQRGLAQGIVLGVVVVGAVLLI